MTHAALPATDLEARTIARVTRRLVPFLVLCYFVAYLDRVNVGFAALTMNADIGLSASAFGFGAGIFFVAYFFFEIPSNLILERVGARRWIARIMFTWGVVSGAMAFVTGEWSFIGLRALLGVAEAGFFPGIIFYLTLWFPTTHRARIVGAFMAAIPLSTVIGAPISGLLLGMHGFLGLKGWQWLFLLEAAPSLILSVAVLRYLTDRPADAAWLPADEKAWLIEKMASERRQREAAKAYTVAQVLREPAVWALSLIYFAEVATNYGLSFFLPQIVKAFGVTNLQAGVISAVPYAIGTAGILWWSRRSDRRNERRLHLAFPMFIAAAGIAVAAVIEDPFWKMAALTVAGFGIFACLPVFWTFPTAFLSGAAAAGGIAMINSIGNLAGFAGPFAMGRLKDVTGTYTAGLLVLAATGLIGTITALAVGDGHPPPARE